MFGPDVNYVPDEPENGEEIETPEVKSLRDVLCPLSRIYRQYDNIRITVNPHGR
jgi:hypothetical protein